MCLSSVYEVRGGDKSLLCEYVSGLTTEGGIVTITDIMGAEKVVKGDVTSIDLVNNVILIAS
jgi:predicted RNA-binding protein